VGHKPLVQPVGVPELDYELRIVVTAVVPLSLMLSDATPEEIAEQSWPEFRRALQGAIIGERVKQRALG